MFFNVKNTTMKRILLTLQLFAFPLFFYAQTTVTFSSTGTTSFYVPAGVPSVTMNAWGGGGGGGGSTVPLLSLQRAAAGGGGGAFAGGTYTMTAGVNTNLSITVGTGGTAGAGSSNGGGGGSSLITSYITAVGGGGGTANSNDGNPAAGAAGLASASTGQTKADGVAGGAGQTLLPAVAGSGGQGGNSGGAGGAGATGLLANANGSAGTQPGGGGGGSKSAVLGSVGTGGVGGAGRITIVYTCPTYTLTSTAASIVDLCSGTSSTITLVGNLPFGLYTVAYQVGGVTQTPANMTVSTSGGGTFSAPGFTVLGTKSLTITSLTSGTSSTAADNCTSNISSGNTATVTITSSGTAPVALAGTGATCSQITANWQAVAGATYYELDVATDINFTAFVSGYTALNVGNVLTKNIPGLSNATNYYYRVRAFSGTCISANSSTINYKPAVIPSTVVSTAVTNNGCASFTANWNAEVNATSYLLDFSTDSNFGTFNSQNVGNVTSFLVTSLSSGTTYYYRIRAQNGCGSSASYSTVQTAATLNSAPIAPTAVTSNTVSCTQFSMSWGTAVNATTYEVQISTNSGFPGTAATQTITGLTSTSYTFTGLTSSTIYYYRVLARNVCGASVYGVPSPTFVTTLALPTTPSNNPSIQPTCLIPTGTVILKGLPNRSDYTIAQTGTASNSYTGGTGSDFTTYTITGLVPGSYNFTVQYPGSCASLPLQNITINSLVTNTYTVAGGWSSGNPTIDHNIVFADDFSSTVDLNSCTCKINAGKKVIINSTNTLIVENGLTIDPTVGSMLTFKNNASLIQVNTNPNINSGTITYERITPPIFQKDYEYWSTPVSPQKLVDVSPDTTPTKYFGNNGTAWVATDRQSNMVVGKGYIIRGPATYNNSTKQAFTANFVGVPNNGDLQGEDLENGKYYVIGNPYPSALSADALVSGNSILNGTMYFWTHNTAAKPVATNQYTNDDYASYNQSGGVSAKSDPLHSDNPGADNGVKPTGKIAAGQAFYISTKGAGKVQFKNTMRFGAAYNTQFFKSGNTSKETTIEKNRIWLNMTNIEGAFKQLLVGYIEGATNDFESDYDGISLDGNIYIDFYSINNNDKYVIQGRALPFIDSDIVPLGYRTTVAGDFTIAIDEVDDNMKDQPIYIEDKTAGVVHDLRASNYTFTTAIGTFTDRLVLRYTNKTLGTRDFENLENGISVSVKNKAINIMSSKENIKEVSIYDVSGRQLYNKKKVGSTELQIGNLQSSNQVLMVKVILDNDFTSTRKTMF